MMWMLPWLYKLFLTRLVIINLIWTIMTKEAQMEIWTFIPDVSTCNFPLRKSQDVTSGMKAYISICVSFFIIVQLVQINNNHYQHVQINNNRYQHVRINNNHYCQPICSINISWTLVAMCYLSDDIYDYHYVSQGKVTVPSIDDGEDMQFCHVSADIDMLK